MPGTQLCDTAVYLDMTQRGKQHTLAPTVNILFSSLGASCFMCHISQHTLSTLGVFQNLDWHTTYFLLLIHIVMKSPT